MKKASKKQSKMKTGKGKTSSKHKKRKGGFKVYQRNWRSCPSCKKVPGTSFVVDAFEYVDPRLSLNYFLTHFKRGAGISCTLVVYICGFILFYLFSKMEFSRSYICRLFEKKAHKIV